MIGQARATTPLLPAGSPVYVLNSCCAKLRHKKGATGEDRAFFACPAGVVAGNSSSFAILRR
jgi:hypothetical protein